MKTAPVVTLRQTAAELFEKILDVGCDSGVVTRFVAPHARSLMGIDFIHAMLKDTRTLSLIVGGHGNPWLVTAGACRLPIRSGAFGKVYASAMRHTLPTRALGLRAIGEMIRVTASGGTVLLSSVPETACEPASHLETHERRQQDDLADPLAAAAWYQATGAAFTSTAADRTAGVSRLRSPRHRAVAA